MAEWIQDDFAEGFNLIDDVPIRHQFSFILPFFLDSVPKRLSVYPTRIGVVAHWHGVPLAIPLEFPLKCRTSIDCCGTFIMCSQVLPRSCQEVRRTFSMAAMDWHVEPIWRYAKIQLVV